ncbi:unnamed protein product [Didymodactylos carnosus]|uniref:Uncharacterized protein n=1 Tax=Didymodactylos carnosus TaxID=1234261 RepID=A0A813TW51_9BILA|nr:unnamed protein product [Didymodactylos carnosus]CAF0815280.1 unnamed protein product [Didymodactylos carnosus]CAF3542834.1 unnamed protein product [Didymodactylos carnosus]CAF3601337.1 unnamed protein product [Didymodactylos carnosus]
MDVILLHSDKTLDVLKFSYIVNYSLGRDNIKDDDERAFNGQRISLTLRTVATFRHVLTGKSYSQDAKCKTSEEFDQKKQEQNDAEKLLHAFSAENQDPNFDWDK